MIGQANFSQAQLQGKSCNDIQNMLLVRRDINWNDFPVDCKRGASCIKYNVVTSMSFNGIGLMPNGESGAEIGVKDSTSEWIIDTNMPIIKNEDRYYIEKLVYTGE